MQNDLLPASIVRQIHDEFIEKLRLLSRHNYEKAELGLWRRLAKAEASISTNYNGRALFELIQNAHRLYCVGKVHTATPSPFTIVERVAERLEKDAIDYTFDKLVFSITPPSEDHS